MGGSTEEITRSTMTTRPPTAISTSKHGRRVTTYVLAALPGSPNRQGTPRAWLGRDRGRLSLSVEEPTTDRVAVHQIGAISTGHLFRPGLFSLPSTDFNISRPYIFLDWHDPRSNQLVDILLHSRFVFPAAYHQIHNTTQPVLSLRPRYRTGCHFRQRNTIANSSSSARQDARQVHRSRRFGDWCRFRYVYAQTILPSLVSGTMTDLCFPLL